MIATILGSAAGGGVPQWNCGCENCMRARRGVAPARTQSSIALSADGRTWILFNASVDLPRQFAATPELWAMTQRTSPFAAILLTDGNVDHTAGLGELRQDPDPFVVVSTPVVRSLLVPQLAYERFDRAPHRWLTCEPGESDIAPAISETLARDVQIFMVDVPGVLPGYADRQAANGAVVAYVVRERASGAQALIAPVFADFNERLAEISAASDVVFLDGSFYSDDELARGGFMQKPARHLGHAPIGGDDGTLSRIMPLTNRRIFVHINNTNPILDPASKEYETLANVGCEVAYDGMRVLIER